MACPICGPKLSAYCMVLSVWGIFMLALLGVFFYIRSPALFEDIPLGNMTAKEFDFDIVQQKYEQNAINCWIAAGLYFALFIFSFTQQRMNSRANYEMS